MVFIKLHRKIARMDYFHEEEVLDVSLYQFGSQQQAVVVKQRSNSLVKEREI